MMRFVRYNGKTEWFCPCTSPRILVKNQIYVVTDVKEQLDQTNYVLEGVEGEFNAFWFDDVETFLAYTALIPIKGYPMRLFRMEKEEATMKPCEVLTSEVQRMYKISKDVVIALTIKTVYIVQIL